MKQVMTVEPRDAGKWKREGTDNRKQTGGSGRGGGSPGLSQKRRRKSRPMVVGGTECLDRTYVESPGRKPGTNGMVQPLGQSLEFGQSESGDAGGYTKWRQCRGGWANHGTNQGELDKRAGMLARR